MSEIKTKEAKQISTQAFEEVETMDLHMWMLIGAFGAAIVLGLIGLLASDLLTFSAWQTISYGYNGEIISKSANPSAILRDIGLVILAIVALALFIWRIASGNQIARTTNQHLEFAEKGRGIDRFQRAATMLMSERVSVRMAGVRMVQDVASRESETFALPSLDLICLFAREQADKDQKESVVVKIATGAEMIYRSVPDDLVAALKLIPTIRSLAQKHAEEGITVRPYLDGINLSGYRLGELDFSHTDLQRADLRQSNMTRVKLKDANLSDANLYRAKLNENQLDQSWTWQDWSEDELDNRATPLNISPVQELDPTDLDFDVEEDLYDRQSSYRRKA